MSLESHISALEKHLEELEVKIRDDLLHVSVDDLKIEELKRERLRIKELIDLEKQKLSHKSV